MIFWDSSAIIPLCVQDENTAAMREIAMHDDMIVTWWGSVVECRSAFSRLRREAVISMKEEDQLIRLLDMLASSWMEILPSTKSAPSPRDCSRPSAPGSRFPSACSSTGLGREGPP
jgi:predicted nucleic acid-binding protein